MVEYSFLSPSTAGGNHLLVMVSLMQSVHA